MNQTGSNATITKRGVLLVYWEIWSILIFLGILIILGNSLVCSIFIIWKQLRNPTNTFLVMLALADLLIGAIFIPLYIGGHYLEYYQSVSITENIDLVLKFTFFASVFNLYAVTADRYIAVLHALRYNALMTPTTVRVIATAAWLCPAAIIGVLLIFQYAAADAVPFVLFGMEVIFVIIPGFLMAFAYVKIFIEAKKQIKQVASLQVQDANQEREKAKKRKAEQKVAKTCALLLCVFVLCWIPTCIEQILDMAQVEISTVYTDVAMILLISNSAVNPLLYGLTKQDFRDKIKKIFGRSGRENFDTMARSDKPHYQASSSQQTIENKKLQDESQI